MLDRDLTRCQLPREQHEKRQSYHLLYGTSLKKSVEIRNEIGWEVEDAVANKPQGIFVPMAKQYSTIPFGAANTVEKAGCICFVSYYLLQKYDVDSTMPFLEWVDEVVQKGYRTWKFSKYPGTFYSPKVSIDEARARFEGVVDLTDCGTEEELFGKLGEPVGIGGSVFLMDNVISCLSGGKAKAVEDTRIKSVTGIINNLKCNFWVPLRVNNAIYHDDSTQTGGHYVTLYGVKDGYALVWDSSIGNVKLPFMILMNAVVADKGLITAWDIRSLEQK